MTAGSSPQCVLFGIAVIESYLTEKHVDCAVGVRSDQPKCNRYSGCRLESAHGQLKCPESLVVGNDGALPSGQLPTYQRLGKNMDSAWRMQRSFLYGLGPKSLVKLPGGRNWHARYVQQKWSAAMRNVLAFDSKLAGLCQSVGQHVPMMVTNRGHCLRR
jgi:hypothetical protein